MTEVLMEETEEENQEETTNGQLEEAQAKQTKEDKEVINMDLKGVQAEGKEVEDMMKKDTFKP